MVILSTVTSLGWQKVKKVVNKAALRITESNDESLPVHESMTLSFFWGNWQA